MSSAVEKALAHLNKATDGRQYAMQQDGDRYVLVMPGGIGEYPGRDELATRQLMMRLTNAAEGRAR